MNLVFRLLDICFLSILYLFMGLIFSDFINELFLLFSKGDPETWSTIGLMLNASLQISFIAISAYIIRTVLQFAPNPFYIFGYTRSANMPETNGGLVMSFTLLLLQSSLASKLLLLHQRIKII